jgi:hypothetical protein
VKNIFLLCATAFIVLMPVVASSADINGEWVVEEVDKKGVVTKTILEFDVEGNKVTGSMLGYLEDEWPLLDGKISGDKISFTVKESRGNRTNTNFYVGIIKGDTIEFRLTVISPGRASYKFTAKRVMP